MFDIEYKGGNCVVLNTKNTRVVIDPNLAMVGLKPVAVKGGVVIATEERFLVDEEVKLRINGPGEYEVGNVSIKGVPAQRHIDTPQDEKKSTMYRIGVGDVRIAVLGNVDPKLTEDQLEDLGVVDLLILPVGGGGYTLDATSASTIVRQIDPQAVIPVHYADSDIKYEVPQEDLDVFVKELSVNVEEVGAKFKVKTPSAIPASLTVLKIDRS